MRTRKPQGGQDQIQSQVRQTGVLGSSDEGTEVVFHVHLSSCLSLAPKEHSSLLLTPFNLLSEKVKHAFEEPCAQ